MQSTLNSAIDVGHNKLQVLNPHQKSSLKLVWTTIVFQGNWYVWVTILFYATFVLELILNVLVGSFQKDLQNNLGSGVHIISTPTRQFMCPRLIISTFIFHPH